MIAGRAFWWDLQGYRGSARVIGLVPPGDEDRISPAVHKQGATFGGGPRSTAALRHGQMSGLTGRLPKILATERKERQKSPRSLPGERRRSTIVEIAFMLQGMYVARGSVLVTLFLLIVVAPSVDNGATDKDQKLSSHALSSILHLQHIVWRDAQFLSFESFWSPRKPSSFGGTHRWRRDRNSSKGFHVPGALP